MSIFLHLPSTITRWCPPFTGCWNRSKAVSTPFARDVSILRCSHARRIASDAWSSLWNTSRALMAGFGGMRCGNFPSLNFYGRDRRKRVKLVGELFPSKRNQSNRKAHPYTQTTNIGSKMKLCSSNDDSPPSGNSDDLRARILLILSASAQSEGKIDECDERNNEADVGNLESGKSDSFLDCRRFLVPEPR